ncbi:CAX5, partial [Symbiodinium sp. CCMP2456]
MAATPWQVGDRVTIAQTQLCGTIKFIGVTEFAGGEWMGIELDEKAGKNNGCVKGKAYFDCKPDYGIFVRPTAVARIPPSSRRRSSAVPDPTLQPPSAPASPIKQALLGLPSPSAAAAARRSSLRTSRREEEGDRSREIQKASVQLELAEAMEDHDVDAIRRMLPAAHNLGIAREEIAAAQRILSWELKQSMQMEVKAVSRSVSELSEAVGRLEAVSSTPASPATSSAVSRLGEELQKRVWQSLESKIHQIVDGALSRASTRAGKTASHPLEAYGFEHFDLNGDGIVTREIFEEARKKIMAGQLQEPMKATANSEPPSLSRPSYPEATKSLLRHLYSRAARSLEKLENHDATRFVVGRLLSRGLQRALTLGPASDALADAKRDIAAIRASRLRIEDATRKAEELVNAASTRVQAAARGRLVRREKDLVKKSTITLQRALRRLKHRRQGKKLDFSVVVAAATEQRKAGLVTVVQGSLIGSILSNLLLVLGMAFLAAGFVQKESVFNEMGAAANVVCLALGAVALALPAVFTTIPGTSKQDVLEVSRASSGVVAAAYICFLVFQLCTHSEMFAGEEDDDEEANLGLGPAILILLLATVAVAFCSELLVDSIEGVTEDYGLPEAFIGVILLPIVGNAAEHAT